MKVMATHELHRSVSNEGSDHFHHSEHKKHPKVSTKIPQGLPTYRDNIGKDRPMYVEINKFNITFEPTLQAAGLTCDKHWERLFNICFLDDRLDWVRTQLFGRHLQWNRVQELLNDHFETPGLTARLRSELYAMTMKQNESILDFGDRFRALMHRVGVKDNWDIASIFLEKLPQYVNDTLIIGRLQHKHLHKNSQLFDTVTSIIEAALLLERRPKCICTQAIKNMPSSS